MMLDLLGFASATTPPARCARNHCLRRSTVCGISVAALLLASAGCARAAASGVLHLRCTNRASGATLPFVVDFDHSRVDSLAATITDKWISWHDPKQGFFDLERATGNLRLRNASATGGYFLYYTCRSD
jgi:hypothetical protein